MLGRLILLLLQIVIAWLLAPIITDLINVNTGFFELFILAVIFAIIVFLVGVLGAQVLRDIGQPGSATLSFSLILALIFAAIATWGPQLLPSALWTRVPEDVLVLAGAIIGYWAKR